MEATVTELNGVTLGMRLRRARKLAGVKSIAQMALLVGVHKNSAAAYEVDKTMPPLDVASRWAEQTGVRLEWLAFGHGDPHAGDEVAARSRCFSLADQPVRHLAAA